VLKKKRHRISVMLRTTLVQNVSSKPEMGLGRLLATALAEISMVRSQCLRQVYKVDRVVYIRSIKSYKN